VDVSSRYTQVDLQTPDNQ